MKNSNKTFYEKLHIETFKDYIPGNVYYFDVVDSTNSQAKYAENVPDKSLFIAERQKAGRGRRGRVWSSPAGCGIWMTIYLKPDILPDDISKLTLLAGLAVSRAISGSTIKWPNDVLIGNKKVCGILTEAIADNSEIKCVVVGIGINVNTETFPDELIDKATSLFLETGTKQKREDVLCLVLQEFYLLYENFTQKGFGEIYKEYINKCSTIGKEVLLIKNCIETKATAVGMTENGELLVDIDGKKEVINSGEVSVRGLLGYN